MKVWKVFLHDETPMNHASGACQSDQTLCGYDLGEDSVIVYKEAEEIEGRINCESCLQIIRHCAKLSKQMLKRGTK